MTESGDPSEHELTEAQLGRLLEVGRALVSELDLEAVLRSVLDAARELTGARYAALGVLDEDKQALERFITAGIDQQAQDAIGPLPRGRGVLGELISSPEPLRLADVGAHEHSFGFPANHPPMKTFLGTPVLIRGQAWGNLYLTEKQGGAEFTEADESVVIVLAAWAAVAIENARLYESLDRRRADLELALRGLEMNSDIARGGAAGMSVNELIELIAKRGRSLVGADTTLLLVAEDHCFVVAGAAGESADELVAERIPWDPAEPDAPDERSVSSALGIGIGSSGTTSPFLIASLPFRGRRAGALVAIGRDGGEGFDSDDRRVFESFAISAATTIASVRSAEAEKVKLSIQASEREKQRWARELHDQTLQELGALRFMLETATKGTTNQLRSACERAIEHVDRGIENLQGLITELRPAVLDELGIGPAIEALVRDASESTPARVAATVELAYDQGREPSRLSGDLEATIYRIVQESLNNALKHGGPDKVSIEVLERDESIEVRVTDDGGGFDPDAVSGRFGLVGMRERVDLAGGELSIDSKTGAGTVVSARLPALRAPAQRPASVET